MFDYSSAAATAVRLLQQYGAPTTLTKKANTVASAAAGTVTKVETPYTVIAAVLPYSGARDEKFSDALIWGKLATVLVAANGARPAVGDDIAVDGGPASVIGVTPIAPAGVPVLYTCSVQKG